MFLCILLVITSPSIDAQRLPVYDGSFRASGEIGRSTRGETEVQLYEEIYDATKRKAALRIVKNKDTFILLQDFKTKHNFWIHTKGGETTCTRAGDDTFDTKRWNKTLTMIEAPDGLTYISLRELLVLGRKVAMQSREEEVVRSMYCMTFGFHYDRDGKRDSAAMSWTVNKYPKLYDPDYTSSDYTTNTKIPTTTLPPATPLKRPPPGITDLQSAMKTLINETRTVPWYAHFILDDGNYNHRTIRMYFFDFDYIAQPFVNDLLEIPEGVFCENYYNPAVKKPIYYNRKIFKYEARVWSNKRFRHRYLQGWIDIHRQLYKIKYTPFVTSRSGPLTLLVSGREGTEGIVYDMSENNAHGCKIINSTNLDFDIQMIILPWEIKRITTSTFFTGVNKSASLNYTKQTRKGGVPCHLWSVLRYDWPHDGIETLWEWCFINSNLQEQSTNGTPSYVASLDVNVRAVPNGKSENQLSLSAGETISFVFHRFDSQQAELMQLTSFDTTPCYSRENSVNLQLEILGKNTSPESLRDPVFLLNASKEIARVASLKPPALRVTNMKGHTVEEQRFVTCTLLGRHSFSSLEDNLTVTLGKLLYHTRVSNANFSYQNETFNISNVCYKPLLY